jgi:glycosyltransferase involved in cell wall biosynthesis
MQISVVIPTCERKARLLSLLQCLYLSSVPIYEVIIVDSGNDKLSADEMRAFTTLNIQYISSERSVCVQRNTGIRIAKSPWILLCDDDVELPENYLEKLIEHIGNHSEAGAVSGIWLEKQGNEWKSSHPVHSNLALFWQYFFQLGIWGEIKSSDNILTGGIKQYYKRKGNHISKAGWPVNTVFSEAHAIYPVYSLGASLVKRQWLIHTPFDEVLDPHGIGENYGVTVSFPFPGVQVVHSTFVRHHLEPANRLKRSLQYYRRVLALDYFIKTRKRLSGIKRRWLLWSLTGNLLSSVFSGNLAMTRATVKAMRKILFSQNPYYIASKKGEKIVEPAL